MNQAISPVRGAERALAAIGGTRLALGAAALALVVTRVTWPLFAQTPFALLFVAIMIAAQWADDVPGLLAIPLGAAAHALLFSLTAPVAFSGWSLVAFMALALGMNRLIVSRRRTEAALRASEAEWRSGWEHAAMGTALLDVRGCVIRINPALARMFGCQAQSRTGIEYREWMQPADGEGERVLFEDLAQGRRDEYRRETVYRSESGSAIWARAVMSLIRNDRGQPTGALLMLEDITDRKALEEQVRQIQKLDAMGRLVASVAHDFNNLLTAIGGYAELAREKVEDPAPRRELDEVLEVTRRATALTRQLLMLSRRPSVDPPPLQLDAVIESMTSLVRRLVGPGVQVVTTFGGAASVKLDPSHLEQIVVNLAVNARDAMPHGGTLTIETSLVDLPGPDAFTRTAQPPPGHYAVLTVSDTGVGMDERVKARLFEPFFTTKGSGEGTGLGLATVYGIVKLYGAYIWVESEPGRGSRFTIHFPLVPALDATTAPASVPIPELARPVPTPTNGASHSTGILVIEDDTSVRGFTCAVLRDAGYDALDAATGEEALTLAASARGRPLHLIVADVALPGIGGAELVRQLRRMRPDARVLYASGFSALALRSQGVIDEASAFLPKPFTRHELLAAVQARLADGDIGATLH